MLDSIKCVLVGDSAVGKTSLLVRFISDTFPDNYRPTVYENTGVDVFMDGVQISLGLWDTSGSDAFKGIRPLSYQQADVVLMCYSVANHNSFLNLRSKWIGEIRNHLPRIPVLVVSGVCGPTFCQLAYGPDGQPLSFAVLEYDCADAAERVQAAMDGALIGGNRVCVSFCAPGLPGHQMLPALIAVRTAAQSRGRGLLPDPTLLQILSALRSPTAAPLLRGALGGKRGLLGAAPLLPFCPTVLQSALQNPMRKPGLLGEAPLGALPRGIVGMPALNAAPLLGDTATGGDVPPCPPVGGVAMAADRDGPSLTASLLSTNNRRSAAATGSLLGEPPKDFRIPRNPYLNLRSLLPPSITGIAAPKPLALPPHSILGTGPTARIASALREPLLPSPGAAAEGIPIVPPPHCAPLSTQTPIVPPTPSASHGAPPKTPVPPPPPKRPWSQLLPPPERSPEGCYVGQHSQGLGGHYADSYLKRKRIF